MNLRKIALALTLLAGTLAVGAARAGSAEVHWSVTLVAPAVRLPVHVVLPLPPIHAPRFVVAQPYRHIVYPQPHHGWRHDGRYGDADRDGILDRRDRVYSPRWDRDGDGVPNREDARPNDPRYGRGWQEARRDGREDRRDDRRDGRRGRWGD